ncbi:MAG: class I SAM-dependent methyltransferase [Casimicrobiaceae bacterium]|nr:class I SAM-dependent methyltransferase [Casimicrobiaceae bacterium]
MSVPENPLEKAPSEPPLRSGGGSARRSFLEQAARFAAWAGGVWLASPLGATSPRARDEGASASGEEVPFVPTPERVVRRMLQLAEVTERDVVWDLGSGDGRIVIAAARDFGARAVGYEIDRSLVELSRRNARRAGVAQRAVFIERDLFTLDFSAPSVVTLYLLPEANLQLRPRLLSQLRPGSRIVSHEWDMGDWPPDETLTIYNEEKPHGTTREHRVFLWVVPAQVAGRWAVRIERRGLPIAFVLDIEQRYQRLSVRADRGEVRWARLTGTRLDLAWRERADGGERLVLRGEIAKRRGTFVWLGEAFSDGRSLTLAGTRIARFTGNRLSE